MSSETEPADAPVIRLRGVDKTFAIYERPHHRLLESLVGRRWRSWHRDFRALQGIDLDVRRGETVGLIGRNGSGKSTLLQVVCGILVPSAGEVMVKGRVAALLELGAGFNAEFTGRENVFLNGSLLGLERSEIEARFDAITAFADIGEFIDQPVKTYSSGMFVRLAFAVAINVDPDILIIDEALSVGDEAFQRKCFARIERIRDDGATVLFVSHGAATVAELCDRAVLLDAGEMLAVGAPKPILSRYHKLLYAPADDAMRVRDRIRDEHRQGLIEASAPSHVHAMAVDAPDETGAEESHFDPGLVPEPLDYVAQGARILDARIETTTGRCVNVLRCGARYVYRYRVRFERTAALVRFGMMIRTVSGLELAGCASAGSTSGLDFVDAGCEVGVSFEFRCLTAPGTYFLNAGVLARLGGDEIFLARRVDAAMFRALPGASRLATGLVDFEFEPSLEIAQEARGCAAVNP